jgi:hypothetical protein
VRRAGARDGDQRRLGTGRHQYVLHLATTLRACGPADAAANWPSGRRAPALRPGRTAFGLWPDTAAYWSARRRASNLRPSGRGGLLVVAKNQKSRARGDRPAHLGSDLPCLRYVR